MARSDIVTLLSLDRYARVMGISPAHFNGAAGSDLFPVTGSCSDIWFQHAWQAGDRVSRDDLAQAIFNAEEEIARLVGYYPAPKFINDEIHTYPRHHRRDVYALGLNVRGMSKSIRTKYARIVNVGQRNLGTKIDCVPAYSSEMDPVAYDDTVTVTAAHGGETDTREWHVFVADHDGDPEWEIRDPRSVEIVGANVVFKFWAWQFIDPDYWEAFPTSDGARTLDLTDAIYLLDCDVYRVYVDTTEKSAEFLWEPENDSIYPPNCAACGGTGCAICSLTTQDGCLHIRDVDRGLVVPAPGSYDEDEESWVTAEWSLCREPDQVKLWYYAGDLDRRYLDERSVDPLSNYWAETIAWLATARIERNFCSCSNLTALVTDLRTDLSRTDRDGPSFFVPDTDISNPLGTRKGELMAWRRIKHIVPKRGKVAVI